MACGVVQTVKKSHMGYTGDVKSSLPDGYGVYTYHNSFFTYEGDWNQGVKDGLGTLQMKDGSYYKGQFSNGEMDGFGLRYWAHNGNTYEGQFEKGEMCGKGVMKYGKGNVYEGSWVDNMRHGDGILTEADGSVYIGSFYSNKRHGEGKQTYSDGGCYEGGWINDLRHGHGKLLFQDGSIYEGQWKADEMHGDGILSHSSQITYNGMWNNGRPIDEPTSICIVGDEEISLEFNEMCFSVHIECQTNENEITTESGRCLMVTAGLHTPEEKIHPTPSRISPSSKNETAQTVKFDQNVPTTPKNDSPQVITKKTTPFGYDVEPYPLYTKIMSDRNETPSTSAGTPLSIDASLKSDVSTVQTPTTPTTPKKSFRDAVKSVTEQHTEAAEYIPVTSQRTVNGKASFLNLVLPTVDCNNSSSSVPTENIETKNVQRKKEECGSGGRRKKVVKAKAEDKGEVVADAYQYKPGDYVIIIEDITESPFLDILLEPLYIPVKVPLIKRNKSSKGTSRADK